MSEQLPSVLDVENAGWLAAIRTGDEAAFLRLVSAVHPAMLRVAQARLGNRRAAETAVVDAWSEVLRSVDRLEWRVSLRASIVRVLAETAERCAPTDAVADAEDIIESAASLAGFDARGRWIAPPLAFPEESLASPAAAQVLRQTIEALPLAERQAIELRDVEGFSCAEICEALGLAESRLVALLGRGRERLRRALEQFLRGSQRRPEPAADELLLIA